MKKNLKYVFSILIAPLILINLVQGIEKEWSEREIRDYLRKEQECLSSQKDQFASVETYSNHLTTLASLYNSPKSGLKIVPIDKDFLSSTAALSLCLQLYSPYYYGDRPVFKFEGQSYKFAGVLNETAGLLNNEKRSSRLPDQDYRTRMVSSPLYHEIKKDIINKNYIQCSGVVFHLIDDQQSLPMNHLGQEKLVSRGGPLDFRGYRREDMLITGTKEANRCKELRDLIRKHMVLHAINDSLPQLKPYTPFYFAEIYKISPSTINEINQNPHLPEPQHKQKALYEALTRQGLLYQAKNDAETKKLIEQGKFFVDINGCPYAFQGYLKGLYVIVGSEDKNLLGSWYRYVGSDSSM